jgi:quinolinate synthase
MFENALLEKLSIMDPFCLEQKEYQLEMIREVRRLKKKLNAVVLSHYYMPPILQIEEKDGGIADFAGDSLALSVAASHLQADHIIFCGVKFMAETAKILNPDKKVFIPSKEAGCSLAESITAKDVSKLKEMNPGIPVIAYINTYAETKAESDICCTSRNALKIAQSFSSDTLIFIPDIFMGRNLQSRIKAQTGKELILWDGKCEVHEQFTPSRIKGLKMSFPEASILVHWEVPDDTVLLSLADRDGIVGSTSDIIRFVKESKNKQFILGSECDLGATLRGMFPKKEFVTPCISCPHMKQITLFKTLESLNAIESGESDEYRIELSDKIIRKAYLPVKRMLDLS